MHSYFSSRTSLFILILEFIVNVTVLAHPQRVTTPSSQDSGCDVGYSCIPAQSCPQYREDNDFAIFLCSSSPDFSICCRMPTPAPQRNRTTTGIRMTTIGQRPTTTTAPSLDSYFGNADTDNVWSSISPELQEKAKLLPVNCGKEQLGNKILNGEVAELGQFPWMVLIGYEINGMKQFWCGGSLINDRYVLTAAHCSQITTYRPTLARLGEWNVSSVNDCQTNGPKRKPTCSDDVIDAPIEEVIIHERFGDPDLPSLQNDIALIRLAVRIEFTDFIIPICLSPSLRTLSNDTYTVSGWGVSKPGSSQPNPILQYVEVYLFDSSECNGVAPAEVRPLVKGQFCAGGIDGKDACKGDSGGPLSYDIFGKNYQKGIVSLATSEVCGTVGRPSIYTEVSEYINWILMKIKP